MHNGDHLRRGADAVDVDVFAIGTAAIALEVALVVLVCQRHRVAALAAAVAGFGLAVGYVVVHFLPERSWLSDPLLGEAGVDGWSLLAASIEVVAAVALGVVGVHALGRLGGLASAARPHPTERTLRGALLHPLALAFTVSQVVTIAISFAQV